MAFHNELLPEDIAYGMEGGGGFRTIVQTTASGHEYRIARQAQARHRYRLTKKLLTLEQFSELKDFFIARRGALHGFRFKDWKDFTTAEDGVAAATAIDVVLGTGDNAEKDFQLIKTYDGTGPNPYARTLSLPLAGSVLVALDGSPSVAFTVTNPGGLITFTTAPGIGVVVSAGCTFHVPVRFNNITDEWMRTSYDDFARIAWEDLELLEILDEIEWSENWWPGGSSGTVSTSLDITLHTNVKLWTVDPTTTGLSAYLPAPDRIPGGEVFVFHVVVTAAGNITVRDDAGTAITAALTSGITKRIALSRSGSTATWIAY